MCSQSVPPTQLSAAAAAARPNESSEMCQVNIRNNGSTKKYSALYSNVLNDPALPRKIFLAANREARYATTDFDSDIRVGQKITRITKWNN